MIDEAAALYGLDPAEFVAARTALARTLRAGGRKDDAAAVARLRRPSLAEHAVNRAARTEPELAERWGGAVDAVERAQAAAIGAGSAGADDLRAAMADLRACTASLVEAAVRVLPNLKEQDSRRNDLIGLVRSLATTAGTAAVRHGVVGAEAIDEPVLFAGAAAPPPAIAPPPSDAMPDIGAKPASHVPPSSGATRDGPSAVVTPPDQLDERRAARARREAQKAAVAALDAAVTDARNRLASATTAATTARAEVAETSAVAAAAARAHDDARARLRAADSARSLAAEELAEVESRRRAARRDGATADPDR